MSRSPRQKTPAPPKHSRAMPPTPEVTTMKSINTGNPCIRMSYVGGWGFTSANWYLLDASNLHQPLRSPGTTS